MVIITEIAEDHRYGVFLSFRGVDTRRSFTDHLYKALMDANIKTFLDDEEIETGEVLKPELESAIKASKASIIVLSKNYATSTWCLDELVLILEQRLISHNYIVIPIFYHVEPTDIRKQQNSFGDAMDHHKQRMEAETNVEKKREWVEKIGRWKKALTEVADLKGKDVNGRRETEFIEEIVTNIYRRIGGSLMTTLPYLFGMEGSIEFVTSWLKDGASHTADILTILGMGGIGKTSLARYVYGSHAHLFDGCSFIEGIGRTCSAQVNGLLDLQKQLCSDISKSGLTQVHDNLEYTVKIEKALTQKKVFIILDDVDSIDQLCLLLGKQGFHPGSKIIITTKDASFTKIYASSINPIVQPDHKNHLLKGLDSKSSLELLSHHAFMSNGPKEGYKEVSEKLMEYCEGHPLALKVLGESLHNQPVAEWEDRIQVLKEETDSHINKALRMSFDSIPLNNDKELFKHISCLFIGLDRVFTGTILNACKIHTLSGFRNLIDRCLLVIGENDILMMHSLIQEMGRDVVRQESREKPWKRSLLWCHEESLKVLKQKKGTGNIKGLALNMKMLKNEKLRGSFQLQTDALSAMDNLMILHLDYMQINGSYENFPEESRWLRMHGFPLKSIPSELPMENLVALDLSYSKIVSFGNPQPLDSGKKQLFGSLKFLDLSFCKHLQRLGSFLELPVLERLLVRNCTSLIEICESLEQCVELVLIDLSYCNKLEKFPTAIGKLKNLETLLVDGCNTCERQIKVRDTDSQTSSSAIVEAISREFNFFEISFPSSLVRLSLAHNNLSNESFPMNLSFPSMLKYLRLDGNPIVSMPNFVRSLNRLEFLSMVNCLMLTSIEHPPSTLRALSLYTDDQVIDYLDPVLRRILFNPEMSPISLLLPMDQLESSSVVVEGRLKIQPMVDVEEKVLNTLGWTDLDSIKRRHIRMFQRNEESLTQMYYEFGIFSTIYGGKDMPHWIRNRSQGKSISFTIPLSSKKLTGLNFCHVQISQYHPTKTSEASCYVQNEKNPLKKWIRLPKIRISNITQNHTWIYKHYITSTDYADEDYFSFLSHWMFGMNEMVGGDQVTITVQDKDKYYTWTAECGISFVYNDESIEEEEEDVLGYYKSWNHIIGGDLSGFQITTGEYFLDSWRFNDYSRKRYKEDRVSFRAFSKRKSDVLIREHQIAPAGKKWRNDNSDSEAEQIELPAGMTWESDAEEEQADIAAGGQEEPSAEAEGELNLHDEDTESDTENAACFEIKKRKIENIQPLADDLTKRRKRDRVKLVWTKHTEMSSSGAEMNISTQTQQTPPPQQNIQTTTPPIVSQATQSAPPTDQLLAMNTMLLRLANFKDEATEALKSQAAKTQQIMEMSVNKDLVIARLESKVEELSRKNEQQERLLLAASAEREEMRKAIEDQKEENETLRDEYEEFRDSIGRDDKGYLMFTKQQKSLEGGQASGSGSRNEEVLRYKPIILFGQQLGYA